MPPESSESRDARPLLLEGKIAGLALMAEEDVPAFARWYQDLEFAARMGTPGDAATIEMRRQEFEDNSRVKPHEIYFSVLALTTGELVGFGGLCDMTRALAGTLCVGVDPRHWGKGYGSEATRLICEYGFFFKSLYNIKVEVNGYNAAAIRLYERLGFKAAGRLRGAILLNGRRYDQVLMDVVRDEFPLAHVERFRDLERTP